MYTSSCDQREYNCTSISRAHDQRRTDDWSFVTGRCKDAQNNNNKNNNNFVYDKSYINLVK